MGFLETRLLTILLKHRNLPAFTPHRPPKPITFWVGEVKALQIHVELLVPYNRIANTRSVKVEVEGHTLDKLLEALIRRIPALENHLTGEEIPGASPFLLLINGKVVPVEKPSEIFLEPGDRVGFTRIVTGG